MYFAFHVIVMFINIHIHSSKVLVKGCNIN